MKPETSHRGEQNNLYAKIRELVIQYNFEVFEQLTDMQNNWDKLQGISVT